MPAVCLCLNGCRSDGDELRRNVERLERERVAAEAILAKAVPTTRQVVPADAEESDLRIVITVEADGHTGVTSSGLRYQPAAEQLPVLENGQLALAGGVYHMSHGHGVSPDEGGEIYEEFSVSIGPLFASGGVVYINHLFEGHRRTRLWVAIPVLWDVPVQMFYWPSGRVRVEIQPLPAPTSRPGAAAAPHHPTARILCWRLALRF